MRSSELTAPEHADRLVLTPHAKGDLVSEPMNFGGVRDVSHYWKREGRAFQMFRIERCITYHQAANVLGITTLEVRAVELGRFQFSQLTARRLLGKAVR
jgi:hypothetical protein